MDRQASAETDDCPEDLDIMAGQKRTPRALMHKGTVKKVTSKAPWETRDNRVFLEAHKHSREKDAAVKALVVAGIRQNRFCAALDDEELDIIFERMEYFKFDVGESVVRQGDVGYYFFVAQDGQFDVLVNGVVTNSIPCGTAFGAIALLYACPRTATVTAKEPNSSVWGADASNFKKVLLENTQKNYQENLAFLDHIRLFDGLSAVQKETVAKSAILPERVDAGNRVVTEGEAATAIYFVKKGLCSVTVGGSFDASGKWTGGSEISQLKQGDVFGERAVLYGELRSSTVVATEPAQFITISVTKLKEVLGENLIGCLELSFILSTLRKLPIISHLSLTAQSRIAQAMTVKSAEACEPVLSDEQEANLEVMVVIEGEVSGQMQGKPFTTKRSGWCGDEAFVAPEGDDKGSHVEKARPSLRVAYTEDKLSRSESPDPNVHEITAGPDGARVAILLKDQLVQVLKDMGLSSIGSSMEALDYMRQVLCAKKVPIFRGLSPDQINNFVKCFVLKTYKEGANVITQGEVGSFFFVIAKGEVNVIIDGHQVRQLGKNSCFGERSLLFDERRTATVEVSSETADLWSLDKATFNEFVCENMREELNHRIRLQDTSVSLKLVIHVRLIGKGAFGSVRLVEHKFTGLRYALKRIKKKDGVVPPEVTLECNLMAEMDHPFILQLVKTFESKDSIYILSDLVTGGQLHEQLGRMGVLTRKQAQFYVASLVLILEHLHDKNIVYRDLKPENVMLDAQGYLKLVDFGLAKKLTGKTYTLVGTLFYMAPEVIDGHGYTDTVDIWSCGVMFFEFVCGRLPFGDEADCAEVEVLQAIMTDDLQFPSRYNDSAGKRCMTGMLTKDPAKRLGVSGYEELKNQKFFKAGVSGDIFSKIIGREMEPPVVPEGETYSDVRKLDDVTLSDADELGKE